MRAPDGLPLVLLVDGDLGILRGFKRMARHLPLRLVTTLRADEALALIERDGPPALLISAYQLPGMDGLSLLAQVKLQHPGVRVVLSTGTPTTPASDSGIGVLPKPVDVEGFARLVESLGDGSA